ncbi:hypothetical protein Holit_00346 [Hollandina sp. SP2]
MGAGLNEHTNGLIWQYLPKGTSFEGLIQSQLDRIVEKTNTRPRKALGYRFLMRFFLSIFSHFKPELAFSSFKFVRLDLFGETAFLSGMWRWVR